MSALHLLVAIRSATVPWTAFEWVTLPRAKALLVGDLVVLDVGPEPGQPATLQVLRSGDLLVEIVSAAAGPAVTRGGAGPWLLDLAVRSVEHSRASVARVGSGRAASRSPMAVRLAAMALHEGRPMGRRGRLWRHGRWKVALVRHRTHLSVTAEMGDKDVFAASLVPIRGGGWATRTGVRARSSSLPRLPERLSSLALRKWFRDGSSS